MLLQHLRRTALPATRSWKTTIGGTTIPWVIPTSCLCLWKEIETPGRGVGQPAAPGFLPSTRTSRRNGPRLFRARWVFFSSSAQGRCRREGAPTLLRGQHRNYLGLAGSSRSGRADRIRRARRPAPSDFVGFCRSISTRFAPAGLCRVGYWWKTRGWGPAPRMASLCPGRGPFPAPPPRTAA